MSYSHRIDVFVIVILCAVIRTAPSTIDDIVTSDSYTLLTGDYTQDKPDSLLDGKNSYLDYPTCNDDGTVNAFIEIPQGTNHKWETSIETGHLFWELKNGSPRVVNYLGYPGNYGMIPRTLGGDGDPLDVIVLGGMIRRGTVIKTKVIGVMFLSDDDEVDDKLLAVTEGSVVSDVASLKALDSLYPGITSTLSTWFTRYKGPDGRLEVKGFGNVDTAMFILNAAKVDTSVAATAVPVEFSYCDDSLTAAHCIRKTGDYAAGIPDSLLQTVNVYTGSAAKNDDGTANAVVEIPAGTNAKWETSLETGQMFWELKNNTPRTVKYCGYPGNYGMIPQTLGGDGDPLDVIVLGDPILRGSTVAVKPVGVLFLDDQGEIDDKLIAVVPGTPLGAVNSLAELDSTFPGVSSIIESWFTNYKGPDGGLVSRGLKERDTALSILTNAINSYFTSVHPTMGYLGEQKQAGITITAKYGRIQGVTVTWNGPAVAASVDVYTMTGSKVARLFEGICSNRTTWYWYTGECSPGYYIVRLRTPSATFSHTVTLFH